MNQKANVTLLIIWDWDNTLMNTRPAVAAGLQDLATHYGQSPVSDEEIVNVMTRHRGEFWQKRFQDDIVSAVEYYIDCYLKHLDLAQPFEKTTAVLKAVANQHIPQVLLSNKNHDSLLKEVAWHGLESYFSAVLGTTDFIGKPDPLFVRPILKQFRPRKIILIGDGQSDMDMARNIGATAVLVHRPESNLPRDYTCATLNDVLVLLEKIAFKNK